MQCALCDSQQSAWSLVFALLNTVKIWPYFDTSPVTEQHHYLILMKITCICTGRLDVTGIFLNLIPYQSPSVQNHVQTDSAGETGLRK